MTYNSVLDKNQAIHYIDEADIIRFIGENSTMESNRIYKFVREKGITSSEGVVFWTLDDVNEMLEGYDGMRTPDEIYWVSAFFEGTSNKTV